MDAFAAVEPALPHVRGDDAGTWAPDGVWPPTWQPQDVQNLLWFPDHVLDHEVWGPWVRQWGGLRAVHEYLLTVALSDHERQLLQLFLDQPRASSLTYAQALHISRPTYFRRRAALFSTLAAFLNAWPAPSALPTAAVTTQTSPTRKLRSSLPMAKTCFVGREEEIAQLCALIRQPELRLLTLTGTPGVGKTRMAIEAAAQLAHGFVDGVVFIPLAALVDASLVAGVLGRALEVQPSSERALFDQLSDALAQRDLLLVLDNFEHLLQAAPLVGRLLDCSPRLKVLCTSRTPLQIYGEREVPVHPLPVCDHRVPSAPDELLAVPSIRLLVNRIQAVRPDFQLTKEAAPFAALLCAKLEGLPLAIELTAAWAKVFSLRELCGWLDQRLALLTGGPQDLPHRQRTLCAAIDWSYQLLAPDLQRLFVRVGVFRGGWTIEALAYVCAETSCEPDHRLEDPVEHYAALCARAATPALLVQARALANSSLIRVSEQADGTTRFNALETIREYALRQLSSCGEEHLIRTRHAAYYAALAQAASAQLKSAEQSKWLDQLEQEQQNLRDALQWSYQHGECETFIALCTALLPFWMLQCYLREGRGWLEKALLLREQLAQATRARLLNNAAIFVANQGDYDQARLFTEECLSIYRAQGDHCGQRRALHNLGNIATLQGQHEQARRLYEQSLLLEREAGDRRGIAGSLLTLARVAYLLGDHRHAETLFTEALAINRELENILGVRECLVSMGTLALSQDANETALACYTECLALADQMGVKVLTALALIGSALISIRLATSSDLQAEACARGSVLASVVETLLSEGVVLEAPEQRFYEELVQRGLVQLGQARFDECWANGKNLTLAQAIAEVLAATGCDQLGMVS